MNFSKLLTLSLGLGIFPQLSLATSTPFIGKNVIPTCLSQKDLRYEVQDLCLASENEERQYEFIICSPVSENVNSQTHYIAQTKWDNKEDGTGQRLTNLFLGFSNQKNATVKDLEYITLIDDDLLVLESSDLSFSSSRNGLQFELTIMSSDGDYLEGTILDSNTGIKTQVECRDVATQSSSRM